jgi:hypothetical protein
MFTQQQQCLIPIQVFLIILTDLLTDYRNWRSFGQEFWQKFPNLLHQPCFYFSLASGFQPGM